MAEDEVVVISDDDSDLIEETGPSQIRSQRMTRHFLDLGSSPIKCRDSKRPKIDEEDGSEAKTPIANQREFPRIKLHFENGNDGFTQAFPDFFNDVLLGGPSPKDPQQAHGDISCTSRSRTPKPCTPQPKTRKVEQPYYDDPKLNLRMYCGPGYQAFPLPVDSNPEFQEVCDRYDEKMERRRKRRESKQTRHNVFGPYIDHSIRIDETDISSDEDAGQTNITKTQQECLAKILEILPDVDHQFVLQKLRYQHESYNFGDEEIELIPDAEAITFEILEMDDYPKAKKEEQTSRPDTFERETGKLIKWNKENAKNRNYLKDALILLASHFNYVPTHHIQKVLAEKQMLWDSFICLEHADKNWFQRAEKPYRRLKQPRTQLEKKYRRVHPYSDAQYYIDLVIEFQATKQHVARIALQQARDQEKAQAEEANLQQQKADGLIVECQICFEGEVPLNRAVPCSAEKDEHYFCYSCVESLAQNQVGMMKHQMMCMDGGGCKEKLDADSVAKAIPIQLFDLLQLNEQQAELAAAFPEGLDQCPFCDFKALCGPLEDEPLFSCQHPDCYKVTCRKCREISHQLKTCEEAKKDRGLNARHKVEEARSEAMMRTCPSCQKKIIKEAGCNKMTCTCGGIICYVCKLDLSKTRDPYGHFSSNSGCSLHDSRGQLAHDRDADEAEIEAIKAAKANDAAINEQDLQIETGKKKPPPVKSSRKTGFQLRNRVRRDRAQRNQWDANAEALLYFDNGPADLPPPYRGPAPVPVPENEPPRFAVDPFADLLARRADVEGLQDWIFNQKPGDRANNLANDLQDNLNNVDMVATGNRIQNFRNDFARRRRTQVERTNRRGEPMEVDEPNPYPQFPNPAIFHVRDQFLQHQGFPQPPPPPPPPLPSPGVFQPQQQARYAPQTFNRDPPQLTFPNLAKPQFKAQGQEHQQHQQVAYHPTPNNDTWTSNTNLDGPNMAMNLDLNFDLPWRARYRPATPDPRAQSQQHKAGIAGGFDGGGGGQHMNGNGSYTGWI